MNKNYPSYQKMIVAMMLAIVGGFLDAYTYALKGGVFANAQTGNFVLLGINICKRDFNSAISYIIPITTFAFGIITAIYIKRKDNKIQWGHWHHIILIIEATILFFIGFITSSKYNLLVCVLITYVCAIQVTTFRSVEGLRYASTMCTGNTRFACDQFVDFFINKNKQSLFNGFKYCLIITFFCIGAGLGTILCNIYLEKGIWFCCIVLILVWCIIAILDKNEKKDLS